VLPLYAPYPLPQSKAYWKPAVVSALDGSSGLVSARLNAPPSFTGLWAVNAAVGATLFTVTVAVYSVNAPSLSITLPLTERVPLSVVLQVRMLVALATP